MTDIFSNSWYDLAFGPSYLKLYSHRSEEEAREQVDFLAQVYGSLLGKSILDVGCGAGRHLRELEALGARAVGIDRSSALISAARTFQPSSQLLRADMRALPFKSGSFEIIGSFFTSFGYFDTDAEHLALLREWARVLTASGVLFLDYLNRNTIIADLVPEDTQQADGYSIKQTRWISNDSRRVEKKVQLMAPDGSQEEYIESVRLYDSAEVIALLADSGFKTVDSFGSINGETYAPTSPRLILFAKKQ